MIELKKSELESTLLTISTYDNASGKLIGGLLSETLTLGTKRGLQKIHKATLAAYKELIEDIKDIQKECGEDKELQDKELQELFTELVKIDVEPIKLSFLENVSTSANYNFDLIEKIAV